MSTTRRSDAILEHIELLLVDGDNLLHAARGSRDHGGVAWLLPRLAGWRPAGIDVVVGLDGYPAPGMSARRPVAAGIVLRYSGAATADDLLVAELERRPYAARTRSVVITADRQLQDRARRAGALTRSVEWLVAQLSGVPGGSAAERPAGAGIGRPVSPSRPTARIDPGREDEREARPSWGPGRGATRKRGNPRRSPRRPRA